MGSPVFYYHNGCGNKVTKMSFAKRFNLAAALEQVTAECDPIEVFEDNIDAGLDDLEELQESVEFSVDEIGKGLEGIADLIGLSNKLQNKEGCGVAIESYSDMANIAYASILKRIGLEDGEIFDKDDPTGKDAKDITPKPSGKIKQMVEKIIEIVKRIWEKAKEYFKKAFDYVSNRINKTIKYLEDLNDSAKIAVLKAASIPNIEIENPAFFTDKKLITVGDVFESTYLNDYGKNSDKIGRHFEAYEFAKSVYTPDQAQNLLNRLSGKREKDGLYVTPEGYIHIEEPSGDDGVTKISFSKNKEEQPVAKQTLGMIAKFPASIDITLDIFNSIRRRYYDFYKEAERKINEEIPDYLALLQSNIKNSKNEEDAQRSIDVARRIKQNLTYLTSIRNMHNSYTGDLVSMINYYVSFIQKAASAVNQL